MVITNIQPIEAHVPENIAVMCPRPLLIKYACSYSTSNRTDMQGSLMAEWLKQAFQ